MGANQETLMYTLEKSIKKKQICLNTVFLPTLYDQY